MKNSKKVKGFAMLTLMIGMLTLATTQVSTAHGNDKYYSAGSDGCLSAKDHHCPTFPQ